MFKSKSCKNLLPKNPPDRILRQKYVFIWAPIPIILTNSSENIQSYFKNSSIFHQISFPHVKTPVILRFLTEWMCSRTQFIVYLHQVVILTHIIHQRKHARNNKFPFFFYSIVPPSAIKLSFINTSSLQSNGRSNSRSLNSLFAFVSLSPEIHLIVLCVFLCFYSRIENTQKL